MISTNQPLARRENLFSRWCARAAQYDFHDQWLLPGTLEEVAEVMFDPESMPLWWPAFRSMTLVEPGDENGVGSLYQMQVKGPLPYELALSYRVREKRFPDGYAVDVFGDFEGEGTGTFTQVEGFVRSSFRMRIECRRPLIRFLSAVARPLLALQHRWVIWRGAQRVHQRIRARRQEVLCP